MRKKAKRLIAALLASVLVITDGAAGFAAETQTDMEQNEPEISEENAESELAEEQPYVLFEMEELREQSVKQYRLSDGTVLAAQYGMDVHYEDEDGEWAEIYNRFLYEAAEDTADFDGYKSVEGAVEFKFAPQVQEGELVKITHENYEVGFEMLPPAAEEETENLMTAALEEVEEADSEEDYADLAPAQISFLQGEVLNVEEVPAELAAVPAVMSLEEEAEVIWADVSPGTPSEEEAELFEGMKVEEAVTSVGYGNVLPGVSLQYVLSGSSLKEYILVNEKSDSYSYNFAMNLENLESQMQEDGSILLLDAESGDAVYEIPAGYMTDAAGESSDAVTMSVTGNAESGWILNVTADAGWVNAEERVLPVQIDPTISHLLDSETHVSGSYVTQAKPTKSNVQREYMRIGYCPADDLETRIFVQFKNLPQLPENSIVCAAKYYFGVADFAHHDYASMSVLLREITGEHAWGTPFTWNEQPSVSEKTGDYQKIKLDSEGGYTGWNITELVKDHYLAGNGTGLVSGFGLYTHDVNSMNADDWANAILCMDLDGAYPVMQIIYRDVKGIESYYTYQIHDGGNAGTVYLNDHNGQITVIKPVVSYESTVMSYGLELVYNSVYGQSRFTENGKNIQTKDFSAMNLGIGWKLSAQETVTETTPEEVVFCQ